MNKRLLKIFFFIIPILIIIVFILPTNIYNNLTSLNEEVKLQWGQVENSYQRRIDLIPNLVKTVKGVANFEKNTIVEVIEARAKATSLNMNFKDFNQNKINKYQKIQENLNTSLSRLLFTVEKYPDIKSIKNFSYLQSQLEGTENRINIERNRFNEKVQNFNKYRNRFPNIIISNFFKYFNNKGYFKSYIKAYKTPIVNL